ncbi:MAG: SusC/RagA family TonB-linked outer membrane protein, partial [Pedobacter sp.]
MRATLIVFLICIGQTFAIDLYSQNKRLTLNMSNVSIKSVLATIENQSEFYFMYEAKNIDVEKKISVLANNKSVPEILNDLFAGTNIIYKINNRQIALTAGYLTSVNQQQKPVSGKVTDSSGGALPGVTILVKGTNKGVITDSNGNFTITNVTSDAVLVFSFLGMKMQEIQVGAKSTINVTMAEDAIGIEEVVAIGYGSQRKKDMTGAISSIISESINKSAITSFTQNLQGKVPGLTALQSSGQPGAGVTVKIRSNPSLASSGVLYVLDGVPVNDDAGEPGTYTAYGKGGVDRSPLNFINPNDIESIVVLKDGAAASIYGARAGAGVVLITTKRGTSGKSKIEYSGSYAFQQIAKNFEVLSATDWMNERNRYLKDIWLRNNNVAPFGITDPSTVVSPFVPKYTDEQIKNTPQQESAMKAISRNGFVNQHNISLSGGTPETKYFVSGNYLSQNGVLIDSDYERYNGRINLDQIVSNQVKMGFSLTTSNSVANNPNVQSGGYGASGGIIWAALFWPPNIPLQDKDGNYLTNPEYANSVNPATFSTVSDKTTSSRLVTSGYAEWTIIPRLKAKASLSYDQSSSKRSAYYPRTFIAGTIESGKASIQEQSSTSGLLEYTLNYSFNLGESQKLDLLGGYSYQSSNWEGLSAVNSKFTTDQFTYNNIGAGAAERPGVGSYKTGKIWASYFARAIYELNNKYLFNASIRRDGSSNFAENKKYGLFPSLSAGWVISEEPFWKENIPLISLLKLRASYGTTGNSEIGGNAFAYYSSGNNYVFNNTGNSGVYLSQLNNDNLTWESVAEVNLGLDYQLMKGRITGTFDFFNKTISNLLTKRPLPSNFPVSSIADNVGKTRSIGWELGIQTSNVVSAKENGFKWGTQLTLSRYNDFWVERSPASLKVLGKWEDPNGPFNGFYGYRNDGIYTLDRPLPGWMPGIKPGDVILKDLNGYDNNGNLTGKPDGKLNTADQILLGLMENPSDLASNGIPELSFGFNNTFR